MNPILNNKVEITSTHKELSKDFILKAMNLMNSKQEVTKYSIEATYPTHKTESLELTLQDNAKLLVTLTVFS